MSGAGNIGDLERRIGGLLADFEAATGLEVETVEIESVDMTQIQHDRRHFVRRVYVKTRVRPGVDWYRD